jgi:DNA-binding HxlR family transcriptional regulator
VQVPDVDSARMCHARQILDRVGDKWSIAVIHALGPETLRFTELKRAVDGISQRMLTATLRNLERDGLVSRKAFATVPVTVEYSLTPLGETLIPVLAGVRDWAEAHVAEVVTARERFDARAQRKPSELDAVDPDR